MQAAIATGAAFLPLAGTAAEVADHSDVTGSRFGRADMDGALPVVTITREDIERSGFTSVGELLRNTTFNSLGAFRAQSGSSAQALVAAELRGLGSERTLILIDGRRAPKAPFSPSAQDLNAVPMAMVDRIEVLPEGASAIYGGDAVAGVINIITRKDYQGASLSYQHSGTDRAGGDAKGGQFVAGMTGDRGSMVFGASFFSRDIIFARNSLYNTPGASFFSNNYYLVGFVDANSDFLDDNTNHPYYGAIAGGCPNSDPAFFTYPSNVSFSYPNAAGTFPVCGYNFNLVAADEARTGNEGVFAKGTYKIGDAWQMTASGAVTRAESFGRYAPSLNDSAILVPAGSPNNPFADQDIQLYHRFAALGPRDNKTDANVYDLSGILSGPLGQLDVTAGARYNQYRYYELGQNYVVTPVAEQYIVDGTYDIRDPAANAAAVLNRMKATTTRDAIWDSLEYFAQARMPLFDLGGGAAQAAVGVEHRIEKYVDQYDSLQEGGAIGGASGNSAGTRRDVASLHGEMLLPILPMLDFSVAGRYEKYSDVGSNFAPKIGTRYRPADAVTVRASYGQGFRAPSLDIISALPAFSAEPVTNDPLTCWAIGGFFTGGRCSRSHVVNVTVISNPNLEAEESDQYGLGVAVDLTDQLDVSVDYYAISLDNMISYLTASDLVILQLGGASLPPGFALTRSGSGRIDAATAGYANQGRLDTSGLDIAVNAGLSLGALGRLESRFRTTYLLTYEYDITGQTYDVLGTPGVPEYRASLSNTWTFGAADVALNANHIAAQDGGSPARRVPSYTTWDVQLGYELPVLGGMQLVVGAINVFGREPAASSAFDGREYNFYLYDQYGTQPYVRFTQKF